MDLRSTSLAARSGEAASHEAAAPVHWPALRFDKRYARLPASSHTPREPTQHPDPELVAVAPDALALTGLSPSRANEPAFVEVFAGNRALVGAEPLAAAYSGHQFGIWAGRLGAGRTISLGEVIGPEGRIEIQL